MMDGNENGREIISEGEVGTIRHNRGIVQKRLFNGMLEMWGISQQTCADGHRKAFYWNFIFFVTVRKNLLGSSVVTSCLPLLLVFLNDHTQFNNYQHVF
mmetsp:Transcript_32955/g.62974  ORF Transcript_32955/g.62974 Transcript_32955/m.62974 type:complete len:99 (+) Transcript_32955:1103-1399(+)